MLTIKKYSNRRLYDTDESRYITLDELAQKIRDGQDVQVLDARTGADLTQPTLTQIVIEGRGAGSFLPVAVLTQMVRMGDDFLAEFLGKYVSWALEMFLAAKRGVQSVAPYVPLGGLPLAASDAWARMWSAMPWWGPGAPPRDATAAASPPPEPQRPAGADDIAELRRELGELKRALGRGRKGG